MTYYIPLDAGFYGAGFYNIFQIVRITGRTLLAENRTLVEKMIEKRRFLAVFRIIESVNDKISTLNFNTIWTGSEYVFAGSFVKFELHQVGQLNQNISEIRPNRPYFQSRISPEL